MCRTNFVVNIAAVSAGGSGIDQGLIAELGNKALSFGVGCNVDDVKERSRDNVQVIAFPFLRGKK